MRTGDINNTIHCLKAFAGTCLFSVELWLDFIKEWLSCGRSCKLNKSKSHYCIRSKPLQVVTVQSCIHSPAPRASAPTSLHPQPCIHHPCTWWALGSSRHQARLLVLMSRQKLGSCCCHYCTLIPQVYPCNSLFCECRTHRSYTQPQNHTACFTRHWISPF